MVILGALLGNCCASDRYILNVSSQYTYTGSLALVSSHVGDAGNTDITYLQ